MAIKYHRDLIPTLRSQAFLFFPYLFIRGRPWADVNLDNARPGVEDAWCGRCLANRL